MQRRGFAGGGRAKLLPSRRLVRFSRSGPKTGTSKLIVTIFGAASLLLLVSFAPPPDPAAPNPQLLYLPVGFEAPGEPVALTTPPPPPPPTPGQALRDGVLIVVSLSSQRLFVFRKGEPWASTPVSTGVPGKPTPVGSFPILQKQVWHRSTLYSDAPMPYMQRITWGGIALHAGHVTGRPASHGCIRLPAGFAKKLYAITDSTSVVVITRERLRSADDARERG
ncbi:MAG: L,D-transpeptidase family protein [Novosphingobium sp.]|nr:L,D-transpeptidase family protein [Novosphingobium sp.]